MPSRRDAGRPRGKPVEDAIVRATLDELAAHGIDGVSVARVAEAAQVNKTTVYRRWPTVEALVAAALERALHQIAGALRDTGSLRGDLRQLVASIAEALGAPAGRALVRAAMADRASLEVAALAADPLVREQTAVLALVTRAVARGEWHPRHDPQAVLALLVGSVLHRVMLERQPVTPAWVEVVVEVVARGVRPSHVADDQP